MEVPVMKTGKWDVKPLHYYICLRFGSVGTQQC